MHITHSSILHKSKKDVEMHYKRPKLARVVVKKERKRQQNSTHDKSLRERKKLRARKNVLAEKE